GSCSKLRQAMASWRLLGSGDAWSRPWENPEACAGEQVVAATCRENAAMAAAGVVGTAATEGITGRPRAGAVVCDQVPSSRLDCPELASRSREEARRSAHARCL